MKRRKMLQMIKIMTCFLLFVTITVIFLKSRTFSFLINDLYGSYKLWDGVSVSLSFNDGDGTVDDPYQISNGEQLLYFKHLIETDDTYNQAYYVLTSNINLDNHHFETINKEFKGTLDGNGYSIANINLVPYMIDDIYYGGLFSKIDSATIKNINLKNIIYSLGELDEHSDIYLGSLAGYSKNSTIRNCGIYTFEVSVDSKLGGLVGYLVENSVIENCYVNADVSSNDTVGGIVGYSDNNNIVSHTVFYGDVNENNQQLFGSDTTDYKHDNYSYQKNGDSYLVFFNNETVEETEISLNDLASLLTTNINDEFTWTVDLAYLRFDNTTNASLYAMNLRSIANASFGTHETGISDNIVYINDIERDTNYYAGLNYTSNDGYLPTNENKNIYSEENLLNIRISYYGLDYLNQNHGYVSLSEQQDTFVYYKVIDVNNNGTASLSDDYVEFNLIDNPFTDRPTDMGFNGWITNYQGSLITLDKDTYTRTVRIPVTYNDNIPSDITIDFYASWTFASVAFVNSSTSWSNAFGDLETDEMHEVDSSQRVIYAPYDMSGYYKRVVLSRWQSYQGYYNSYGQLMGRGMCYSSSCTYYDLIDGEYYDENTNYYYLDYGYMTLLDESDLELEVLEVIRNPLFSGAVAGYYRQERLSRNQSLVGYYNSEGIIQTSGTCNSNNCTYYKLLQVYDENGNAETYNSSSSYYYLATRDTNIVVMNSNMSSTWGSSQNEPFTLTSVYNDIDYRDDVTWTVSGSTVQCYGDTNIENITIYSGQVEEDEETNPPTGNSTRNIYGRFNNVKLGRGILQSNTNYTNFNHVLAGTATSTGSSSAPTKYSTIIESGVYNTLSLAAGTSSSYTQYIEMNAIYGSDFDRAKNDNSKLNVVFCASSQWGSTIYASTSTGVSFDLAVKSGSFGTNEYNYTAGIYVGGRYAGTTNSARRVRFEGGNTYNLIGGPLTNSNRSQYNDTYMYIMGGTIDMITSGAGTTATYGNRIVQMTGGKINYSILGGSNGYQGSGSDGTLNGSSFIYVGGNAEVGNSDYVNNGNTLYGAEAGSVFGIGNGRSGSSYTSIGSNDNSNIIIDGDAVIHNNVYGGGNYGATGVNQSSSTTTTNISILGGTIDGSVYGGGNNNGAGSSSKTSTINILVSNGYINGSVYGGSNQLGTIYGSVNINVIGGTVNHSVYGGGRGGYDDSTNKGTFVSQNVNLIVGNRDDDTTPTINNNVYGGSAYGVVNGTTLTNAISSYTTNVTINEGNIAGAIYGGGQGDSNYTPYVEGDIYVNVNGGTYTDVYGGNDAAGVPNADINVNLNGGYLTNVYGGGNNANANNTIINVNGSMVTNLYGGGNNAGATLANINFIKGGVDNTYGGSNRSGNVSSSNIATNLPSGVTGQFNSVINVTGADPYDSGDIYTSYQTIDVSLVNNTSNNIVSWDVMIKTLPADLYTNWSSTEVTCSNNTCVFNEVNRWYGTNIINANSSYQFSFVLGSYLPKDDFKIIEVELIGYDENNNVYNMTDSDILLHNIYGGNNAGGTTGNTNINLRDITVDNIYGGGNYANITGATTLNLNNVIVNADLYGGGNNGYVQQNTSSNIYDSTISGNIFAGGNVGEIKGSTDLYLEDSTVGLSVHGGGNSADVDGNTVVTVAGNSVVNRSVFGGGNAGAIGTIANNNAKTTVNIVGAVIHRNVYGGCNTSVVYGETEVNVGVNGDSPKGNIVIDGTVFGGGEANDAGSEIYDFTFISVTNGILININGDGYNELNFNLKGSIFGSGNASSSSGDSDIFISNLGTRAKPNKAISIQRANLVSISNSVIELVGTTDRTNEYSSIKYSLNRIDLLKFKNNSSLLLQQNANLLKEFRSLVDVNGHEVNASVEIDNNTVTRNVDNRVYLLANKNLNVTTNEAATAYGQVIGMSFFGMYQSHSNGSYIYGIYGMENNEEADASDIIIGGSYILGLHAYDMNYEENGFYSNYIDEEYTHVTSEYINPKPANAAYYMWSIGIDAINYSFTLTASKYSSLGTHELSLLDFSNGNTSFSVIGFNAEGLNDNIEMLDSNEVPKIADTNELANSLIGLSMKAETSEWTSSGTTKFLSLNNGSYTGMSQYLTDNQTKAPSLTFYLYHAKNISLDADLGTVIITLQALTPRNEIEFDVSLIMITVDLTVRTYNDEAAYDASITYGKKYEMPSATDVNITKNSSFTAYYSLYVDDDDFDTVYGRDNTNYHTLSSNYVLPVNTKITMIDVGYSLTNPQYYYYVVNQNDYNSALSQHNNEGEATYNLNKFIKMDSTSSTNRYNDASSNLMYSHENGIIMEEFIFIFDFEDVEDDNRSLDNSIVLELRTNEDRTSITTLGIRQEIMKYSLYDESNVVLTADVSIDDNYVYYEGNKEIDYDITVGYNQTENRQSIIDTAYESNSMGINVTLYDSSNNVVSSSMLTSASITIDNVAYYANGDGVFRIKLANKVSNLTKKLNFKVGNSLAPGNYTMKISLFSSYDGIHINNKVDSVYEYSFTLVGSDSMLDISTDDTSKIVNAVTGKNLSDNNYIDFNVNYDSSLTNPNIRVTLYKRNTTSYDDITYSICDLMTITSTTLTNPAVFGLRSLNDYQYMVSNSPTNTLAYRIRFNENIPTGTYKFVFGLYDNNYLIEDDEEYIIIKK